MRGPKREDRKERTEKRGGSNQFLFISLSGCVCTAGVEKKRATSALVRKSGCICQTISRPDRQSDPFWDTGPSKSNDVVARQVDGVAMPFLSRRAPSLKPQTSDPCHPFQRPANRGGSRLGASLLFLHKTDGDPICLPQVWVWHYRVVWRIGL
jgi:hypothetical protein